MSVPIKISAFVALGAFLAMIALSIVGYFLQTKGLVRNTDTVQSIVKITAFTLFLLLGFSLIPLMVHTVISFQVRFGDGEFPLVKLLVANENKIVYSMWMIIFLGLLIAIPVMRTELFGFQPAVRKAQGVLTADIGMLLDDVEKRSTLKLVPSTRSKLDGSHKSVGGVVFDFQVAGTGVRFDQCRYYFLETYPHDNLKLAHINIGISPRKLSLAGLHAAEKEVRQRLKTEGWRAGHYVYRTDEQKKLHGGATSGDGFYWSKGNTLLILSSKRMDDPKPGENAQEAGEFIQVVDLVPRDRPSYSDLVYYDPSAEHLDEHLTTAAAEGDDDRIKDLLEKGANPDSADAHGRTSLMAVASSRPTLDEPGETDKIRDRVKLLLERGADVNAKDAEGNTVLMMAGDPAVVGLLLDHGANANAKNKEGNTPIMRWAGSPNAVRLLLEHGADVNATNDAGDTALMRAAFAVHESNTVSSIAAIKLLLARHADINARNKHWRTPLHFAVYQHVSEYRPFLCNPEIVDFLLENGADVNARDNTGRTPLLETLDVWHGPIDVVKKLLDKNAQVNINDNEGKTPLMIAVARSKLDEVRLLLADHADVNAKDKAEVTPLRLAVDGGRADIVQLLLDDGADFKAIGCKSNDEVMVATRNFALMRAASEDQLDEIKALLEKGPEVNGRDREGLTVLMHAARKGSPQTIELLLAKGADLAAQDANGDTALMWSAREHQPVIVELLLKLKADPNVRNKSARTARFDVAEAGSPETVALLIAKGADINAKDKDGTTALMAAAVKNKAYAAVKLIDGGAPPDAVDNQGRTALMLAAQDPTGLGTVSLLVEHGANINVRDKDGHTALDLARAVKARKDITPYDAEHLDGIITFLQSAKHDK